MAILPLGASGLAECLPRSVAKLLSFATRHFLSLPPVSTRLLGALSQRLVVRVQGVADEALRTRNLLPALVSVYRRG